jgi:UDP-4-amino-4,6-dideoxy-N-acetyl-beta-L-altrosamine N-acetyltransferase
MKNFEHIELLNFIYLDLEQKQMILNWRNHKNISRWMYNKNEIVWEEHLQFIKSLENTSNKLYFLVKCNNECIGVIDFTNLTDTSVFMGVYSNPYLFGKGNILINEIIRYSSQNLKINSIFAEVYSENLKAYSLYRKFDFKEYGRKIIREKEVICLKLSLEDPHLII